MGTVDQIRQSILDEAQSNAQQIDSNTKMETDKIEYQTAMMVKKIIDRLESQERQRVDDEYQRQKGMCALSAQNDLLKLKNAEIEETYRQALKAIAGNRRKELMLTLWKKAKGRIAVHELIIDEKDAKYLKKGSRSGVHIKMADIGGGFKVNSEDGRIHIDCTIDSILETVKRTKSSQISAVLFADAKTRADKKSLKKKIMNAKVNAKQNDLTRGKR